MLPPGGQCEHLPVSHSSLPTPLLSTLFASKQAGIFDAADFAPEYPWTMDGLMANAGLGHLWVVVRNALPYKNIILSGPLEVYTPEGHHS